MNLDSRIDSFLSPISNKISGVIFSHITVHGVRVEFLIALIIFAAIYFTIRTRFIGLWGFRHAINLLTQRYKHQDVLKKKKKGEVSSFQALTATISASAGMGNIVGSALAVSIGGPKKERRSSNMKASLKVTSILNGSIRPSTKSPQKPFRISFVERSTCL